MIDYAEKYMPGNEKEKTFLFCPEQKALIDAARKKRYRQEFIVEQQIIVPKDAAIATK